MVLYKKYFGHAAQIQSIEHNIMLGPIPGKRRQGGQWRQWLDDVTQWFGTGRDLPSCYRQAAGRDPLDSLFTESPMHALAFS